MEARTLNCSTINSRVPTCQRSSKTDQTARRKLSKRRPSGSELNLQYCLLTTRSAASIGMACLSSIGLAALGYGHFSEFCNIGGKPSASQPANSERLLTYNGLLRLCTDFFRGVAVALSRQQCIFCQKWFATVFSYKCKSRGALTSASFHGRGIY